MSRVYRMTETELRALLQRVGAVRRREHERSPREFLYWSDPTSSWYAVAREQQGLRVTVQEGCGSCS